MASLDKEIKVLMLKGESGKDGTNGADGKSSYQEAVENELFSGTLEDWIATFSTPENYITRGEFQKVTQAQYDELKAQGELVPNCLYLIIDDPTYDDIIDAINENKDNITALSNDIDTLEESVNTLGGNIDTLEESVSGLDGRVTALEGKVVTGSKTFYSDETLYNLIYNHPDIRLWVQDKVQQMDRTIQVSAMATSLYGVITIEITDPFGQTISEGTTLYYQYLV